MRSNFGIAVVAAATFVAPVAVSAQPADSGAGPITLIVPAPPGGGTDMFARWLAPAVEPRLGRKVLVDNKSGGGGTLGITHLVAARPDGNTLAFTWNSPLTAIPHNLMVPYNPDRYRPVMSVGYGPYALCVRANVPLLDKDIASFVRYLKNGSDKLTYGHDGSGGTLHLAAQRIFSGLGFNFRGVPHSGAAQTIQALLGGQVDIFGGALIAALPQVAAGKVKCPLLTSSGPHPALPAATGLASLKLGNEETVLWWGLLAPAGTPDAVVEVLEAAFVEAADKDEFKALMNKSGAASRILRSVEMSELLKQEYDALGAVARSLAMRRR